MDERYATRLACNNHPFSLISQLLYIQMDTWKHTKRNLGHFNHPMQLATSHNGQVATDIAMDKFSHNKTTQFIQNSNWVCILLIIVYNSSRTMPCRVVKLNESPTYPPGPLDGSTPSEGGLPGQVCEDDGSHHHLLHQTICFARPAPTPSNLIPRHLCQHHQQRCRNN